jgi:hypothetical protein
MVKQLLKERKRKMEVKNNILLKSSYYNIFTLLSCKVFSYKSKRPIVDCQPDGKWRIGSTVGIAPKCNDVIIERFLVKDGKTIKKGTVEYVPNGTKDIKYILKNNNIS